MTKKVKDFVFIGNIMIPKKSIIECSKDFEKLKARLETISETENKILFLEIVKKEYLQNKTAFELEVGVPLNEQIDLEIEFIKDINTKFHNEKDYLNWERRYNVYCENIIILKDISNFISVELSKLSAIPDKIFYLNNAVQHFTRILQYLTLQKAGFERSINEIRRDKKNNSDNFKELYYKEDLLIKVKKNLNEITILLENITKTNLLLNNNFTKDKEPKSIPLHNTQLKKFQWLDTEESVLRILELLYNSGFISQNSFKNRSATLRDTFLNKEGKPFNNTQLNTVSSNMEIHKKIKNTDPEYMRFNKLLKELQKLIED